MKTAFALALLAGVSAAAADCDAQASTCLTTYVPVCGSNGKTYANQCVLENAACLRAKTNKPPLSKLFDGACDMTPNPFCGLRCAAIYTPVCGSDGSTYSNPCTASAARCTNILLHVAHEGECEKAATKPPTAHQSKPKTKPKPAPKPKLAPRPKLKPTPRPKPTPTSTSACATVRCTQYSECEVDAGSGSAYCADVCAPGRCAVDEVCSLSEVQCVKAPCPPIATCTKRAS